MIDKKGIFLYPRMALQKMGYEIKNSKKNNNSERENMKLNKVFLMSALILSITSAAWMPVTIPAKAATAAQYEVEGQKYVAGDLIVGFTRQGTADVSPEISAGVAAAAAKMGGSITTTAEDGSFVVVTFKTDAEAQANKEALSKLSGVKYVERNGIRSIPPMPKNERADSAKTEVFVPSDPYSAAGLQWHLEKTLYYLAPTPLNTNVPCIVVIDTGVDYTHVDLATKVYKGKDLIQNDYDPMDVQGHGTHVAGIAAGITNNNNGIAGLSPNSNILAVRVLGDDGSGTDAQVANGILWANKQGAAACGGQTPKVYNMSLGGFGFSQTISDAVAATRSMGRLLAAAAGNSDSTAYFSPASDPNAFAVAATDINDNRTWFSNYSTPASPWVDIAAPGYDIWSSIMGNNYEGWNGTSMATPVVSGIAAQVWAKYPTDTVEQIIYRLKATGDPAYGFLTKVKRVNLLAAIGGNGQRVIQGMVYDPFASGPLENAVVQVLNSSNTVICTITTGLDGQYTCPVPGDGTYKIYASNEAGYINTSKTISLAGRAFNVNLALNRVVGTSTSNDWSVSAVWNGWQPLEKVGKEFDLFAISNNYCYGPKGSSSATLIPGSESWSTYIAAGQGQGESIKVLRTTGGSVQIFLALNYDNNSTYPAASRLTGSGAQIQLYRNNALVASLVAPTSPTTGPSDIWYVGNLNLVNNTFVPKNLIYTTSTAPACIQALQSSTD